jgi:UDP-N-acetylmuramate: L-alanyl-gamma-D-glutamyl-meso-diaminopimelate ligase
VNGHLHILGICGTFMGGLALLAREQGLRVSGSDANVYPPMSTQLADAGIELFEGWDPVQLSPAPDLVLVGNALSRGNPVVEALLNSAIPYQSGAQWLAESVLRGRHVLAVAGTHGKTTTSSLLAHILDQVGLHPGFLIGGVPANFGCSARLGESPYFVVEADEYDTAFFDKRSKFIHYRPRTLCLNNLEYDHADIFPDLAAIQRQFHHLIRCVPGAGQIIARGGDAALDAVLAMGCWTPVQRFALEQPAEWRAQLVQPDGGEFVVQGPQGGAVTARWSASGRHNAENALAALAAATSLGVPLERAVSALATFSGVARRMQTVVEVDGITVYDDFAHHPTAIATTLAGLRARVGAQRIIALIELRSNSMRLGVHRDALPAAVGVADAVYYYQGSGDPATLQPLLDAATVPTALLADVQAFVPEFCQTLRRGDHVVIMSNGGFGGIHQRVRACLLNSEMETP